MLFRSEKVPYQSRDAEDRGVQRTHPDASRSRFSWRRRAWGLENDGAFSLVVSATKIDSGLQEWYGITDGARSYDGTHHSWQVRSFSLPFFALEGTLTNGLAGEYGEGAGPAECVGHDLDRDW